MNEKPSYVEGNGFGAIQTDEREKMEGCLYIVEMPFEGELVKYGFDGVVEVERVEVDSRLVPKFKRM